METTRLLLAHFSPTGTTLKVARAIAEGLGRPVCEVDLSAPAAPMSAQDGDVLLAAVPVYGGRAPAIALERLAQISGTRQPAVAVAVYGNRAYDDALLELTQSLEQNGFCVAAAGAFIAEHSIVRSIAAGRPDEADLAAARAFGQRVGGLLAQGGDLGPVAVPGRHPYREYKGLPFHPKAGKACVQCGRCSALCPVGAIPPEAPADTDPARCITCMRCVALCPQKARALPAPALVGASSMLKLSASAPKSPETFFPDGAASV